MTFLVREVLAGIVWQSLLYANPGALMLAVLPNAMVSTTVGRRDAPRTAFPRLARGHMVERLPWSRRSATSN